MVIFESSQGHPTDDFISAFCPPGINPMRIEIGRMINLCSNPIVKFTSGPANRGPLAAARGHTHSKWPS